MTVSFRVGRVLVSSIALISLNVCGGGGSSPAGPAPGPTPTAAPTPTPVPSEPPLSASCERIGPGQPAQRCPMERATFQQEVDDAIRTLQSERPEIFNGNRVLSEGAYYVGLIRILDRQGICAGFDGEELAVKTDNTFNDQYDILTSTLLVRFASNLSYRTTCYPAAFPLPPGAPLIPPPPGCNLPPSRVVQCGREPSGSFYDDVNAAIGEVLEARPELFDYTDTSNINAARDGLPGIRDLEAYASAVAGAVTRKGYCARWDTRELQVKRTNEVNEQYAITFSLSHVRRDPNMYRSSCYPSSF